MRLKVFGYTNHCQILDASDYGVPQHRKRFFMVSILNGEDDFQFPRKTQLTVKMHDLIEDKVDEKYYLSPEQSDKYLSNTNRYYSQKRK